MTDKDKNEENQRVVAELKERYGRASPENAVKAAKAKDHPWHQKIWGRSDKDLAMIARLHIARQLINSVEVIITQGDEVTSSPAWVRDVTMLPSEQGYVSVAELRSNKDLARDTIRAEFDRVRSSLAQVDSLAAQFKLQKLVDSLLGEVGLVRRQPPKKQAAE